MKPGLFPILIMLMTIACSCREAVLVEQMVEEAKKLKTTSPKEEQHPQTIKDGTVTRHNESSNTTSEVRFEDGLKQGMAKQYYADGQIWKESNYKDGHLHGTARVYDREGRLKREVNYHQGKKHGASIHYFKSGNPKLEVEYDHGLPLPGFTDRDYKGNVKTGPEIIITTEDRLKTESTYVLHIKLSKPYQETVFFAFTDPSLYSSSTGLRQHQLYQEDDKAQLHIEIPPGYSFDEEIHFYAQYDIGKGVRVVKKKAFKLSVVNN